MITDSYERIEEKFSRQIIVSKKFDWVWHTFLFFIVIGIDRITKSLCEKFSPYIIFVPCRRDVNSSVFFGFFDDEFVVVIVTMIASVCVIYMGWYFFYCFQMKRNAVYPLLVVAGGVSNIFDRVWYGGVIDFISLNIGYSFFSFVANLADFFIVFGLFMIIYDIIIEYFYLKRWQKESKGRFLSDEYVEHDFDE